MGFVHDTWVPSVLGSVASVDRFNMMERKFGRGSVGMSQRHARLAMKERPAGLLSSVRRSDYPALRLLYQTLRSYLAAPQEVGWGWAQSILGIVRLARRVRKLH
jgi:hypothetical protein